MMPSFAPIDVPSASAAAADEPPDQDGWSGGLPALRAELDRIDNALHDLLMQRASVVERVAKAGKRGAYRPGREASIIRRLLRRHRGALPPQTLVRLWRELLAGTTAMQGAFAVAVCEPDGSSSLAQAAREHFGALTPLHIAANPADAIAELRQGSAAVAVLPVPSRTDANQGDWWTALLRTDEPRVHVVARLPYWAAPRPDGAPIAEALVVAATEPDASGQDNSLLGLELEPDVSQARLTTALTNAGLVPIAIIPRLERGQPNALALVEVEGFLNAEDPRLARLEVVLRRPVVVGAYAVPETGAVR
jgi:chorismate mutase / prephenate dehydratase